MPASPAPRGELPRALTRSRAPRPRPPQGAISHNEVLELYKKHVDPSFTWKNFTVQEQDLILKVGAGAQRARGARGRGRAATRASAARELSREVGSLTKAHFCSPTRCQARRSNNTLETDKIVGALPDIKINEIHVAMEGVMMRMKFNLAAEGKLPGESK